MRKTAESKVGKYADLDTWNKKALKKVILLKVILLTRNRLTPNTEK